MEHHSNKNVKYQSNKVSIQNANIFNKNIKQF